MSELTYCLSLIYAFYEVAQHSWGDLPLTGLGRAAHMFNTHLLVTYSI